MLGNFSAVSGPGVFRDRDTKRTDCSSKAWFSLYSRLGLYSMSSLICNSYFQLAIMILHDYTLVMSSLLVTYSSASFLSTCIVELLGNIMK